MFITMKTEHGKRLRRTHNGRTTVLLDEGKKKKEARGKMISFRLPKSTDAYLREHAKTLGGITPAILDAVNLHQRLRAGTLPLKLRLQRFALDEGLDWATQEPEVLVKAIERGLADSERNRK